MPGTDLTLPSRLIDVRGVGPERAEQLARLSAKSILDLLRLRPRRYEDRRHSDRIADLQEGRPATVRGHIVALGVKRYRRGARTLFEMIVDDGSGRLHCRWWNLPYMRQYFRQGDEVYVHGKPTSLRPRTMDHPETEVIDEGEEPSIHLHRVTPVYPLTEGLPQRWLRALMWRLVQEMGPRLDDPWAGLGLDGMLTLRQAYQCLHFPAEADDAEKARQRLAFDEFVDLQLALQRRRRRLMSEARGWPCGGDNRLMKPFLAGLGWRLTGAQTRVLKELRRDMSSGHPMRRLVQGDVGSGKTLVAACAALMSIESGFSAAIMAPTEILAEQHYRTLAAWLVPLRIPVYLWTGQRKTLNREVVSAPCLVVGTHALIETGFPGEGLGLVVIDEQHKFGVGQRERFVRQGNFPHLLVMTATPIPRTLGLTLYGDLDVSVIDELPPGRGHVRTFVRPPSRWPKVMAFVREKLQEGRQAYVVCARVEEGGPSALKAVTKEWTALRESLAPFTVALLHGKLAAAEKERAMDDFRSGRAQVLLATTVIEVGVDVSNATVMVIENAEQFGLAQLHQLRGRIGRGREESYCILMADPTTDEGRQRMTIMEQTRDGFRLAEEDLRLRGPGELLGQNQSGLPPFQFADLVKDGLLLTKARDWAAAMLDREQEKTLD